MILRNELIKFYEAMHIKMGMTVDVPCGISIIKDVDTYLEQLKLNVVVDTFVCDNHKPMVTSDWRGLRCDNCGKFEKPKAN